jgi:hypothetical protein
MLIGKIRSLPLPIVKKFHARRIHRFDYVHALDGVITHVVFVVHFAVEQFHADGKAAILGCREHIEASTRCPDKKLIRSP